ERASHEKAYLKSELDFLGASVPTCRAAAKGIRRDHPELPATTVHAIVDDLWRRGIHECRVAAVELLAAYVDRLDPADLDRLERLVREAGTWALVDKLANVAAAVVERHPDAVDTLDRWSVDPDFWVRRLSLLTLLPALRQGGGDFDRFAAYADRMLEEREFFIRKAIGWVLRDTGKRRPELVRDFLAPRLDRAAGLTVREAVKHLPPADRDALLAAYR